MRFEKCEHRRLKKNYPFGRKSKPEIYCKWCGKVIKPHDLIERRKKNKNDKKRNKTKRKNRN